jgi:hypothetical protein
VADLITGGGFGDIEIDGPSRMVLDPLTEVGIGMLVAIMVSRSQLVVDILRHGKRSNGQQEQDKADRHSTP